MDAEYLKSNIGTPLSEGLAGVVLSKPSDPIDHLSRWLLNYVRCQRELQPVHFHYSVANTS